MASNMQLGRCICIGRSALSGRRGAIPVEAGRFRLLAHLGTVLLHHHKIAALKAAPLMLPFLIVVQAPGFALGHGRFAIESAFATHLKAFRALLDPHFSGIVLIAPQWTTAQYEAQKAQMSVLDEANEGIRFVPAYSLDVSRPAFLTRHLLPTWRLLRRETAACGAVNSGMSTNLGHPIMFMACLAARRAGKPVIFMTDIDFREHARRSYRLGRWNWREYAVNHYVYNRLKSLQLRLAPRLFDVVCLKGASLVRDFGGGRPNVHNVYDTVHGADDILDADALAGRIARSKRRGSPLMPSSSAGWSPPKASIAPSKAFAARACAEPTSA